MAATTRWPGTKPGHRVADRHDIAGQFVAENSRRHDHAGVISAAKNLQIGAAGERGAHAHQNVARPDRGNRNALDAHVLFTVQNGREHGLIESCVQWLLRSNGKLLRTHDNLQRVLTRKLAWMRRETKRKLNLIKRNAMRNQQMDRQFAAKNQVGGFFL